MKGLVYFATSMRIFLFKLTANCHLMSKSTFKGDMVINQTKSENVSDLRQQGSNTKFTIIADMTVLTSIFVHQSQHVWQQESNDSVIFQWDLFECPTRGLKRSETKFDPDFDFFVQNAHVALYILNMIYQSYIYYSYKKVHTYRYKHIYTHKHTLIHRYIHNHIEIWCSQ